MALSAVLPFCRCFYVTASYFLERDLDSLGWRRRGAAANGKDSRLVSNAATVMALVSGTRKLQSIVFQVPFSLSLVGQFN